MKTVSFRVMVIAILWMVVHGSALSRGWDTESIQSLPTVQGRFGIDQVGADGFQVSVAGRVIEELSGYGVYAVASAPSEGPAQALLLQIAKGGGSCPQLYRLLDVSSGHQPILFPEIGNCSDLPTLEAQGDSWLVSFPAYLNFKAQTIRYSQKKVDIEFVKGGR